MQVVINISEEEYINIKNAINSLIENGVERTSMSKVCLAILDGAPLPKGHGRLIDADALNFNADYNEPLISKLDFDNAPTIIEADRGEGQI